MQDKLAVQEKYRTLAQALEQAKAELAKAIPGDVFTADRLVRLALTAVTRQPLLLQCTIPTIRLAVLQSAQLGLDPSGVLGEAYIVPFFNGKKKVYEAQLIIGYRGLLLLAYRSGIIEHISAHVVYKDDEFVYQPHLKNPIFHQPDMNKPRSHENIVAAYMVAQVKGSDWVHCEVMTRQEIEAVRARSKQPDGELWRQNYAEACRKTVLRRGLKYLPLNLVALAEEEVEETPVSQEVIDVAVESEEHAPAEVQDVQEAEDSGKAAEILQRVERRRARLQEEPEPEPTVLFGSDES
jgi:recombination protein RecT